MFGRKKAQDSDIPVQDPTGWLLEGDLAEFLLMNTLAIKYMVMFGYTYMHGTKLFPTLPNGSSVSHRIVSMIFQCTGGGIIVPILINAIPVPLAQDAYPIAIFISFLLHQYLPILREVVALSPILKTALIVLYETMRASVVVKLTAAAGAAIAPSDFKGIAVFGPIMCGAIGGCGGAFLPLNKGLGPIEKSGLGQPMLSALIAAACFHLFMNTSLSEGIIDAKKKAQIVMAIYFVTYNLYYTFGPKVVAPIATNSAGENKKTK